MTTRRGSLVVKTAIDEMLSRWRAAPKQLSYHMDWSSMPALNGRDRGQMVQMDGDTFTTVSPLIKLPYGDVHPVNHWRRAK
jgi:hypothetical protein